MFTCSVSVFYSLLAVFRFFVCTFSFVFTTLFVRLQTRFDFRCLLLLFTLFYKTCLPFWRFVFACSCVCAHCLLSLFVFVCLFHKGKIILSVNMSVCGCMCVRFCYDHNNCVCLLFVFDSTCCVTWESIGIFCLFVYEMYLNRDEWDCLRALFLFFAQENVSSKEWER